jgi:hypothetical protein
MLKSYPKTAPCEELKFAPNSATLKAILNYSKSIEVKSSKKTNRKLLLNLN